MWNLLLEMTFELIIKFLKLFLPRESGSIFFSESQKLIIVINFKAKILLNNFSTIRKHYTFRENNYKKYFDFIKFSLPKKENNATETFAKNWS